MRKSQEVKTEIVEFDDKKYLVDKETGEMLEILSDKSSTGKERPWAKHKKENMTVEQAYRGVAERSNSGSEYWVKKADRLNGCGQFLTFNVYQTEEGRTMKVKQAESCRVRLCPVCSWRRSIKIHTHMRKILEHMQGEHKYEYLLVTFTVPNVTAGNLNDKIDSMMRAWDKFQHYKSFKNAVKGWYRGLEITHNVQKWQGEWVKTKNRKKRFVMYFDENGNKIPNPSYDTYHPHFHCIMAVDKNNYFTGKQYIKRDEWLAMWQKAMKDPTITQVDVRKVKPKKGSDPTDIIGAVCEVTKYTVKNEDYILPKNWNMTMDSVEVLDKVLANRRLVAFGGVMKEWHKKLNLDDEIDGNLIENGETSNGEIVGEVCAFWNVGYQQYIIVED